MQQNSLLFKTCSRCHKELPKGEFSPTKNFFYTDQLLPMCNGCIERLLAKYEDDWEIVDKLCQFADIPFIPKKWNDIYEQNKERSFPFYNAIFLSQEFEGLDWKTYYLEFRRLRDEGTIKRELPQLNAAELLDLQTKWGANYDLEELDYLENLYNGMLSSQNVNGALQVDQALKLCKISLEIDNKIREGADFDKLLSSYDKIVKSGDFTPKNVKNASDFDSVGELYAYLEKTGWQNRYYDGAKRDVIDETIANIQNFNKRLWVNESGMAEDVEKRLAALQHAQELEEMGGFYDEVNEDQYEVDGYIGLNEDFEVDV